MLNNLKKSNKHLNIESVNSDAFKPYGRIIKGIDFSSVIDYIENQTEIPAIGNKYFAHDQQLSSLFSDNVRQVLFGEMPIQVGYVNGNNSKLNALEYHKSSEVNIAVTPLVLLLGKIQDITDNHYSTEKVEAFYLPKGTVIEVYGTTLHFAPCKVTDAGFKCAVLLPFGTNVDDIKEKSDLTQENQLLFKTNKWLIAHKEHHKFVEQGAFVGLDGENIEVYYKI